MSNRNSGFGAFLALTVVVVVAALVASLAAPDANGVDEAALAAAREATGGAQTREDIMARQRGLSIDDTFRSSAIGDPAAGAAPNQQLGTLGGVSDPELWRALRYNSADINASARGPATNVLIQDGGMTWLNFRENIIAKWGGWLLLGMIGLLGFFYLTRGRVPIAGEKTGRLVLRFGSLDRFCHWLTASSFLLLGITGLISMYGRPWLISIMGKEAHADLAHWSKLIHNSVSFAFILGVILIFLKWIRFNIPNMNDLRWLRVMGGLFDDSIHPPAGKFNAGQKIIFWSVMLMSAGVVATGISLLLPFRFAVMGDIFAWVNGIGVLSWFGFGELPVHLSPQEEMQYTQIVHAVFAFLFMAMIIGHIYIGTLGMEGAFDAMGTGYVEEQWAREHHSIWLEEVKADERAAQPAE
ncbi:formate dehydrogenase subunit gamma [Tropicimonas sediminicola]|uniref:Formate dehydrogenase gamma subunit n=1 Tax=Tropicimonas sediminicola TaxID=1031541 RepID=A0A239D548_9RHOB|nr:formate dehydrogenase subunit gamma [Tropicimonas sediminicola]SNS27272.1 formate dehydrogenase gamma subunit [Tropicimonas sediminicola]